MDQKRHGRIARLREFQRQQRFVFLFGGLLILLIIAPAFEVSSISRELLAGITSFILISGVYAILHVSRWLLGAALVLTIANIVTLWWEYASWSASAALVHYVGMFIFFFFIIVIIFREITKETSINRNVLYGAVTVYMLLAFTWGLLFAILFILDHNSFRNMVIPVNAYFSPVPFWYVSFLTITTLGYSNVAPASDLAKSFAMAEAVIGQLYLVLQVSLLVGLRVSEEEEKRRERK
jgi:voltage-gated potassium channel